MGVICGTRWSGVIGGICLKTGNLARGAVFFGVGRSEMHLGLASNFRIVAVTSCIIQFLGVLASNSGLLCM